MNFRGNTYWITGAASGMGRSVSLALASQGARLILSDRDEKGLDQISGEILATGGSVRKVVLDMSSSQDIRNRVEALLHEGEIVRGLYQFAGISQRSRAMDTPMENDRKIMEINFFGVVAMAKALLPHMIENGGGQLAVASSLVGKFGFPYRSAYSASKHALHGYFETLQAEYYTDNIRVSILIGGRIQTNISKFALEKDGTEHGKMDPGQANGISAEKAARQILKGLKKEKREILVGGKELLILPIKRFLPAIHQRMIRKIKPM